MNKKYLMKHSAAIHVAGEIGSFQRRAWNVLLANAYNELKTKEIHQISIRKLKELLDINSRNHKFIKKTLEALGSVKVTWNYRDRDSQEVWGFSHLVAEAEIKDGILTYSYGPRMRDNLHNPRIFAKISLSIQKKLKKAHSLALYEICLDYYRHDIKQGETPGYTLEEIKSLLGLAITKYSRIADFEKNVIFPAIVEIKNKTELDITHKRIKTGRRVTGLKFFIFLKKDAEIISLDPPSFENDIGGIPKKILDLIPNGQYESIEGCKQVCHEILKTQGLEAVEFYIRQTKKLDQKKKRTSWGRTIRAAYKRNDYTKYKTDVDKQAALENKKREEQQTKEAEEKAREKEAKKFRADQMLLVASLSEDEALDFENWLINKKKKKKDKIHDGTKIVYISEFMKTRKKDTTQPQEIDSSKEPTLF